MAAESRVGDGPNGEPPVLFQEERQREILSATLAQGRVEVNELSTRFSVTPETIRRDLSDLQGRRLLRRVHGGAVPWENDTFEPLLSVRNAYQADEKRRLALLAVDELPDGGTVIIDSGSTLGAFAEVIPHEISLRIVTNSIPVALAVSGHPSIEVTMVGGRLRSNTMAMVDSLAVAQIQEVRVDGVFISCDGATVETGLTTPYQREAALKRAMIRSARRVVCLVDHAKFGHEHLLRFASWSDVDVLITNSELDQTTVAAIGAAGVLVRTA